jgi:hypothetical protein
MARHCNNSRARDNRQHWQVNKRHSQACRERGRALGEAGSLAGRQVGRELDIEQANVNAINSFNQRLARSAQDQANLAAQIRNQGNMFNIQGRQRIGEMNIQSQAAARDRQQAFAQQQYQNQLAKYGRQAGVAESGIQARQTQAQDVNKLIQGHWRRGWRWHNDGGGVCAKRLLQASSCRHI